MKEKLWDHVERKSLKIVKSVFPHTNKLLVIKSWDLYATLSSDDLIIRVTDLLYFIFCMFLFEIKWKISSILQCKDIPHCYLYT